MLLARALVYSWWVSAAVAATLSGNVVLVKPDGKVSRDHSGVVVWLEPIEKLEKTDGPRVRRAVMEQKNKTFLPHVLAVEIGTAVDFPNYDPIFHNAFSNYDGQVFDLHLYAPQTSRRVVFRRPGMVRVFCNIHATMSAVIAVLPTPHFAVTKADGRFEIDAPAGSYTLQIWHERSTPETLSSLERQVTVGSKSITLSEIRVSEQGYVALPHKNKYGREYRPQGDENYFYPGGRR